MPGIETCFHDGYVNGQDNPYDHNRPEKCNSGNDLNPYYDVFVTGRKDIEGNTIQSCERFTDD